MKAFLVCCPDGEDEVKASLLGTQEGEMVREVEGGIDKRDHEGDEGDVKDCDDDRRK